MRRPAVAASRSVLLVVGLVLAAAGCSEGDPGADGDVESLGDLVPAPVADELTEAGRCADGRLWAADDTGSLAVVVSVPAAGPDEAVLPNPSVEVSAVHEDDPCAGAEGSPAAEGRLEVERDAAGCATTFRLDGLEAEDGTTFGPIEGGAPC